jgi:hypothetical protein
MYSKVGRTVLPSSYPTLALIIIPTPDFLGLDWNGWRPCWFNKVGIASSQSGVAEDGREGHRHGSLIFR